MPREEEDVLKGGRGATGVGRLVKMDANKRCNSWLMQKAAKESLETRDVAGCFGCLGMFWMPREAFLVRQEQP